MTRVRDRGNGIVRHCDEMTLTAAKRLERTPQGYLWCRDVPLARTGTMQYSPLEVPVPAAPGARMVTVERTEDEVFDPKSIESFRGMPLTDEHPEEDVDARNYRDHLLGHVHNPRRGTGEDSDCLIGDILIVDARTADRVERGERRQLSCGYDAKYEMVRPGYGRQTHIRGNHVSLVPNGRAGPRIAIRDRGVLSVKKTKFLDGLRSIFSAKDEESREAAIAALEGALPDEGGKGDEGEAHHHITVNIGGDHKKEGDEGTPLTNDEGEPPPPPDPEKNRMDPQELEALIGKAVAAAVGPLNEQITQLQGQLKDVTERLEDEVDPEDMATQDAVARAEVLKPGFKMPTTDARPGSTPHRDAITKFQRDVLVQAFADGGEARTAIRNVLGVANPNFAKLSPAEIGITFRAASQVVRDANTVATTSALVTHGFHEPADQGGAHAARTASDVNAINRKRWGRAA